MGIIFSNIWLAPRGIIELEYHLHINQAIFIAIRAVFYHQERYIWLLTPASFASSEILFGGELTSAVNKRVFRSLLYKFYSAQILGCDEEYSKVDI